MGNLPDDVVQKIEEIVNTAKKLMPETAIVDYDRV